VDEVLAVGDVQFQKKCLGKMEDVSKNEGRTILFVSHNVTAVRNLTEKIIYLKNGKVEGIGPTIEMLEQYMEDNIKQSLGDRDTSNYRRSERNPMANITSITINNILREFPRIAINMPININIEIDSTRPINSPDINLIIKNGQGDIVTTIASRDNNFVKNLEPGKNRLALLLPDNCFSPGKYFATIGVGPNTGELSFDVLTDYPLFEIYNNGMIYYWPDRPFGNFFLRNVNWQ